MLFKFVWGKKTGLDPHLNHYSSMENSNIDAEKWSVKVVWTYSRIAVTLGDQNIALFNTTEFFFLHDEIVKYLVIFYSFYSFMCSSLYF